MLLLVPVLEQQGSKTLSGEVKFLLSAASELVQASPEQLQPAAAVAVPSTSAKTVFKISLPESVK